MTIPGPIYPLLAQRLGELSQEVIESWALKEGKDRPTSGRLAWRYLKAFLNWCTEEPAYKALVPNNPARGKRTREAFGTAGVKTDALLKEQLPIWFQAVRDLSNPCVTAYLQTVLLTGARPGEILDMHWEDLNTKWKGLTIRDKVEGERVIPLTPYVSQLLATLPRRNKWVFSSATAKDGKLSIPRNHHQRALQVAGIDPVTLHGLRRSFKSLTEWLEIPAGVVAQIMGHKPSATAEKHYTVRPLDLLRVHHERIEAWIVSEAGVPLGTSTDQPKLRSVA
ncbi:tyrosine-type recombinase/integrase [Ottowia thiooxydans]|uniref:tyrosine-type recombinase/integrase n=1 Tax=Ottowia thiooxydans TaxID=219182 RepID=UPI00316ACC92